MSSSSFSWLHSHPRPPQANAYCSLQFNIVSKHLGSERMAHYIAEAAGDIREVMMTTLGPEKAKL